MAADWTERINQIRENPVLHPQTAAKNTAIEAGMIHGDCAFNLPKLFLITIIIILLFYLFILTVSVWKHTGELQGFLLEQQRGFSWQNAVLQDLSHPTSHTVGPARWCRTCWWVLHSPWEIVDPNPVLVNHNTSRHHPQEDLCVALVLKVQGGIIDLE